MFWVKQEPTSRRWSAWVMGYEEGGKLISVRNSISKECFRDAEGETYMSSQIKDGKMRKTTLKLHLRGTFYLNT